jgi:ribosomal protein S18 acetylase RimI-like enzyme/ankyrin repeat protein
MFANQVAWLERIVSGNVLRLAPSHTPAIASVGDFGVAVFPAERPAIDQSFDWQAIQGPSNLLLWSARPNHAADLLFHARGCQESFRPHWMRLSLEHPLPRPKPISGIHIIEATPGDLDALLTAREVPYLTTPWLARLLSLATQAETPRSVWMTLAWGTKQRRATIAGAGFLHLHDDGDELNAALFNLGVGPAWRNRGIGSALTLSLARIAQRHGASGLLLNATGEGERVYRSLGFTTTGHGQTWFMPAATLANRPAPALVAAAEALGQGDIGRLDPDFARLDSLPNGDTPIGFAVRFRQPESVSWLLDHGAAPDIVPLWTTGFRAEASAAMEDARWLNIQRGRESTTPLHDAIRLNDRELVERLLAAGADLTIRDSQWHGRPLDWANALNRPRFAALIERAMK